MTRVRKTFDFKFFSKMLRSMREKKLHLGVEEKLDKVSAIDHLERRKTFEVFPSRSRIVSI